MALAARLDGKNHKVFCLMGDGEQQEGQVWEAAMEAGHFHLDNLIAVIDCNRLQIDGWVKDVMQVEPLAEKYASFGWKAMRVDGHDMQALVSAFEEARGDGRQAGGDPGRHSQGQGRQLYGESGRLARQSAQSRGTRPRPCAISASQNAFRWSQLLERARNYQAEAERKLEATMPHFSRNYWWNAGETMKVAMEPTRKGLGQSLAANGGDERVVCLGLDISGSITISDFHAGKPERAARWFSMGIAEQSATSAAAGLAREGKLPVVGSYATFSAARNLDQIRVSVCYSNLNVLIVGAHAGVSVGPDGATHQALEDLFAMMGLPNMSVVVPCDVVEARKATTYLLLQHQGPKYIRFAREATPMVTPTATPFVFGKANRIRLRHEAAAFAEAFETRLDEECSDEGEDLTIIACGPEVPEAMRAAWILRQEYGYTTRILNMHTLKPIDTRSHHPCGARDGRHRHRGRASDRRAGRASELSADREPATLWARLHYRRHRRQGPVRRLRRALGTGEGTGSERRTHRPEGGGVDGAQA